MKSVLPVYFLLIGFTYPATASTGFGGVNAVISIFGVTHQKETSPSGEKVDVEDCIGQIRIGWSKADDGIYLGLIAENQREQQNQPTSSSTEETASGLSFGLNDKGSYLLFHYFIKADQQSSNAEKLEGDGMGIDLGQHFKLTSTISLGMDLTYRRFKFKSSQKNVEHSRFAPLVGLGFTF